MYTCPQTVKDYNLEKYVFWDLRAAPSTATLQTSTSPPPTEEEDNDQSPDDGEIPEIGDDIEWSDGQDKKEEKDSGFKRAREDEEVEGTPHKRQKQSLQEIPRGLKHNGRGLGIS